MKNYIILNIVSLNFQILVEAQEFHAYNKSIALIKRIVSEIPEEFKNAFIIEEYEDQIFNGGTFLKIIFPEPYIERKFFAYFSEEQRSLLSFENDNDALLFFELNK